MAQSERFYFWRGYYDAMEYLTDDEVGRLFRAICAYAFDGEEPSFENERLMQVAWTMVADTTRESVEMGKRASEGGRKSGEARRDKAQSKGVRKGVRKPPSKGVAKGASNVGYGSTPSAKAEGGDGASRSAPGGAALAPRDSVDAWCAAGGVPSPPVPSVPPEGA